jgi:hypothetical protein
MADADGIRPLVVEKFQGFVFQVVIVFKGDR